MKKIFSGLHLSANISLQNTRQHHHTVFQQLSESPENDGGQTITVNVVQSLKNDVHKSLQ
jgi:hypothetical protein